MGNLSAEQIRACVTEWSQNYHRLKLNQLLERLASHMQYAPIEPGALLSEEDKQEIAAAFPAGFGSQWIIAIWRKIDAVLARRNVRKDKEQEIHCPSCGWSNVNRRSGRKDAPKIDGDVLEAASAAYDSAKDADYKGSPSEKRDCMAAAARVIVDAQNAKWEKAVLEAFHDSGLWAGNMSSDSFLNSVRARLEDKPKTPEERVKEILREYRLTSMHEGIINSAADEISALFKQEASK